MLALTDESVSDETPYFTDLTVTRDPAWNEEEIPLTPSTRRQSLAHSSPRVLSRINHHRATWRLHPQREETQLHGCVNRQSRYDELPRRADPDASSERVAVTAVQHRGRADGWSLPGRPTPSPQGVGRGGVRAEHTKLTVIRPPPYTSNGNHLHSHANQASKSWMGTSHGWVPVDTYSTPVPTSVGRLWVAQATRAQTTLAW